MLLAKPGGLRNILHTSRYEPAHSEAISSHSSNYTTYYLNMTVACVADGGRGREERQTVKDENCTGGVGLMQAVAMGDGSSKCTKRHKMKNLGPENVFIKLAETVHFGKWRWLVCSVQAKVEGHKTDLGRGETHRRVK